MAKESEYTWIYVLSIIFAFFCAFGIGANDLANSFGTTVGSKALTIGQVVVIASIAEFAGAALLGAQVTSTIRSGVVRLNKFTNTPALVMFGFMCVMLAAAFWDNTATQLQLPVSTTHTTVGATVGMALVLRGGGAVIWSAHKVGFPYINGMLPVFLSWIISPLVSGLIASAFFMFVRTFVLRSSDSLRRAMYLLPVFVAGTVWLIAAFVIEQGNKNKRWHDRGEAFTAWVGAVCGCGVGVLFAAVALPLLRRQVDRDAEFDAQRTKHADEVAEAEAAGDTEKLKYLADVEASAPTTFLDRWQTGIGNSIPAGVKRNRVFKFFTHGVTHDVHSAVNKHAAVKAVWAHAEIFDWKTERLFRYLQVFSATVMSFAHGSNDVANALGPFSAVYYIWQNSTVPANVPVPTWILCYGGAGISLGLAIFGHKIMRVLGVKAVKMTNARGFCAELATAITVVIASRYGLPVSTTQCITGAIIAVGLFEGLAGVNWRILYKIFFGWILTLIVAGFVAGAFTAFGAYAPQKQAEDAIYATSRQMNTSTLAMFNQMRAANLALGANANAALTTQLNSLNATYRAAFIPVQKNLYSIVNSTLLTLATFNTSLAYNPYTRTLPVLGTQGTSTPASG